MEFEATVRHPNQIAVETILRDSRFIAGYQQDSLALRIKSKSDPLRLAVRNQTQFLHVWITGTLQSVHLWPSQ